MGDCGRFEPSPDSPLFGREDRAIPAFLERHIRPGSTFSRYGKFVAYVSYPEGTLWKANADGSHPIQLTDPPFELSCRGGRRTAHRLRLQRSMKGRPMLSHRRGKPRGGLFLLTTLMTTSLSGRLTDERLFSVGGYLLTQSAFSTSTAARSPRFPGRQISMGRVGHLMAGTLSPRLTTNSI